KNQAPFPDRSLKNFFWGTIEKILLILPENKKKENPNSSTNYHLQKKHTVKFQKSEKVYAF
ncbi:MAG: hypothetical protein Q4D17_05210, partial [Planctomycetia bacterium]|nr:hypothetical protein [Planctomycetia bacterium]